MSESYIDVTWPESVEIILLLHSNFLSPGRRKEALKTQDATSLGKLELNKLHPGSSPKGSCNTCWQTEGKALPHVSYVLLPASRGVLPSCGFLESSPILGGCSLTQLPVSRPCFCNPIKTHWFPKLYLSRLVTLVCHEFPVGVRLGKASLWT